MAPFRGWFNLDEVAEFVNQRYTNTEPGAVATGFKLHIECRMTSVLESVRQVKPGRYRSRFRICVQLMKW